ncbi:MAG TPA: hypothetical protein VH591_07980 [Ktedonobacterales bacterium]
MMRRPQWAGPRISMLEQAIRRFQDRWETNRQFRAMASGVIGLVMVVALCSCMGVVTTVANSALAGFSAARDSGSAGNTNTGTGLIKGVPTFPTATAPSWQQSGVPPYTIIPNSQTPVPQPTDPPTATPGSGGPGGPGGGPTTCNGGGKNTWALTPCPQIHGQSGTLTISSPSHPNAGLNILLSFGCSSCTFDWTPAQAKLDANGYFSITYTVPAAAANSQVPISGMINISGGPTLSINAAPVQ